MTQLSSESPQLITSKTACLRGPSHLTHLQTNYTGVKSLSKWVSQVEHSVWGARRRRWGLPVQLRRRVSQAEPRAGRLGPARPVPLAPHRETAGRRAGEARTGPCLPQGREKASGGVRPGVLQTDGQALRRQGLAAGPLRARRKG